MSDRPIHIAAISGSLRKASLNTALLRACVELAPPGMTIAELSIGELPFYNLDLMLPDGSFPPEVARVRAAIARADGLLLVSPEYNYSMTAALKNVIDWASRAPAPPLDGKPTAIMGATPNLLGTARGQMALRQALVFPNCAVMARPEVYVMEAARKIDVPGKTITDDRTREATAAHLQAFATWTRKLCA
jgi:chromate reductase